MTKQSHLKGGSVRDRKEALAPGRRIVNIAVSILSDSEGTRSSDVNKKGVSQNEVVSIMRFTENLYNPCPKRSITSYGFNTFNIQKEEQIYGYN